MTYQPNDAAQNKCSSTAVPENCARNVSTSISSATGLTRSPMAMSTDPITCTMITGHAEDVVARIGCGCRPGPDRRRVEPRKQPDTPRCHSNITPSTVIISRNRAIG
jgi:hypothetical protein